MFLKLKKNKKEKEIPMEKKMETDILNKIKFLTGNPQIMKNTLDVASKMPFDNEILNFLDALSKAIIKEPMSRKYPDVVTFAFWIRRGSLNRLKLLYERSLQETIWLGRGIAFHITPSNVPVNFAYSLAAGLLSGNRNIVRIPTKLYPQSKMILDSMNNVLLQYEKICPYIIIVQYDRNRIINDYFSNLCDVRIVWGGNQTISELRRSPLPPKSTEITFADRYSLAIIDSDVYLDIHDKARVAENFYNDTYLSDQNACTSPRIVIWTGNHKDKAKAEFWSKLYEVVKRKYVFQDIQGVDKLVSSCLAAITLKGIKIIQHKDNLVVRVQVPEINRSILDIRDSGGYFYEYDCDQVMELMPIVNDNRCQTIGMIGDKNWIKPLIMRGIKGIDRVVDIGDTMDFDLTWDGYDMISSLSRKIKMEIS